LEVLDDLGAGGSCSCAVDGFHSDFGLSHGCYLVVLYFVRNDTLRLGRLDLP
jgi:hypothetical protein